jgi:hypothetical protein
VHPRVLLASTLLTALFVGLLTAVPAEATTGSGTPMSPTDDLRRQPPAPLASPVASAGVVPTKIQWTLWSTQVVYGSTSVLEGQVVDDDGAVADAPVDLYVRPPGSDHWSEVASTTSSSTSGVFSFRDHEPSATTDYRVVYEGDLMHSGSDATMRVQVLRRVRDALRQAADGSYRLVGSVAPRYVDRRALLQRRTCSRCDWWVVDRTKTNRRSRWRLELAAPKRRGDWDYRVVVPADRRFTTSYGDHIWRLTRS